jgi:TRAP-type C4-dicarboxylate transport system permease small subunit
MSQVKKTKAQFIMDLAVWLFMAIIVFVFIIGGAKAQPINYNQITAIEKPPVNKNLKKYHKQNKKRFKCSACPDRGLKKLLPKSWRR